MFFDDFETIKLDIHGVRLPQISIEENDYKKYEIPKDVDNFTFLKTLCERGMSSKSIDQNRLDEYESRLEEELSLLKELGFIDYILLVWDVINFCEKKDIPYGRGRGSAASSLVLYLSGITNVDPITNGLFFARFVNKARAKSTIVDGVQYIDGNLAPDVDLDICHHRRSEVVDYLDNKYQERFCKLSTYGTLTTKILVKECGKIVSELTEDKMREVSKSIPTLFGKVHSIDKAYEESEKFKEFCDDHTDVIKTARKLNGLIKSRGSHASAYLVSFYKLKEFMPCELGSDGELISSPDMEVAQTQSIKLDLLGLDSLTLVDRVCKRLSIDPDSIDPEDPSVYKELQNLQMPYGLFQISGEANVRVVRDVQPKSLKDLSAVVALARPGALAFVQDYVENKDQSFGNEQLREILSWSNGILIYQEQITQILNKLFGFSHEDGELIRRAIGKKKKDEMAKFEPKIRKAGKDKKLPDDLVEWFWKTANASADYQFNLSHSVSYASLSAITIYLKFKYPKEFFLEVLEMKKGQQKEVTLINHELPYFDIHLLPPDFIKSEMDFSLEGKNIRFALSAIKGISDKSIGNVQDFIDRETANKFEIFQASREAKVNIGILCAMIQAGALSSMGDKRPNLVLEAQIWSLLTEKEKKYCLERGGDYNWNLIEMVKHILDWTDENGKKVARNTRLETIKKRYQPYKEIFLLNRKYPKFAAWAYEKKILGYSYSQTLKNVFKESHPELYDLGEIQHNVMQNDRINFVAEVQEIKKGVAKSGKKYVRMLLADEFASFPAIMMERELDRYTEGGDKIPTEDNILYVRGRKGEDIIWIEKMAIQDYQIYLKLSDLKKMI